MITKGVLSLETTNEQRETMEQPPMHESESPFQQYEEQAVMEVNMVEVQEICNEEDEMLKSVAAV